MVKTTDRQQVLDVDEVEDEETRLLVKWLGNGYAECTYEVVSDLDSAGLVRYLGKII